jgi:hypothetical protein
MGVFGSQVMSFMADISTVTIKTYKSSSVSSYLRWEYTIANFIAQSCLLRYHALIALAKSLKTAKRAVQDSATKDIIKQMKIALTDKSLPIQRAASEVCLNFKPDNDLLDHHKGHYGAVFAP